MGVNITHFPQQHEKKNERTQPKSFGKQNTYKPAHVRHGQKFCAFEPANQQPQSLLSASEQYFIRFNDENLWSCINIDDASFVRNSCFNVFPVLSP